MKPTLKKPSGKLAGRSLPAAGQSMQVSKYSGNTAAEQDEEETDDSSKDESEDIMPLRGLTRSSSAIVAFSVVKSEEDEQKGNFRPGLRHLPCEIGPNVRLTVKPELIRRVCTSETPWDTPPLSIFQESYDHFFSNFPAVLDFKDPLCTAVCQQHLFTIQSLTRVLHSCQGASGHFETRSKRLRKPLRNLTLKKSSSRT